MTTIERPPIQWPLQIAIVGFCEQELGQLTKWLHEYTTLAIEQDRARRGEPVAWMALVSGVAVQTAINGDQLRERYSHVVPLYASPQPSVDPADRERAEILYALLASGDRLAHATQLEAAALLRKAYGE